VRRPFDLELVAAHVAGVDVHQEKAVQLDSRAREGVVLESDVVDVDVLDPGRRLDLDQIPGVAAEAVAVRTGHRHQDVHPAVAAIDQEAGFENGDPPLDQIPGGGDGQFDGVVGLEDHRHFLAAGIKTFGQIADHVAGVEDVLLGIVGLGNRFAVVEVGPQQLGALQP